jgi:hypothetical protein
MIKTPITTLEALQSDLQDGVSDPLNRMQALLDFAKHDLDKLILDLYLQDAHFEARLALRDEEIKELEAELKPSFAIDFAFGGAFV